MSVSGRDVAQVIGDLEKLGLRLSAGRRFDGSLRLDRWRTMSYWNNAEEAERLWSEVVGDDPAAMAAIAAFVEGQDAPSIIPAYTSETARHERVQ